MDVFKNLRSVRLKSHLGTYLWAVDGDVSHGYRLNCRGTVWAVELAGEDYVRLQCRTGLYLGATEIPVDLDGGRGSRSCCRVVLGVPSTPNDNAFLWSPLREGEHLTLSGPYGRLLRARFGQKPQHNAVTVDFGADPAESSWVVEEIPEASLTPPLAEARADPPCRAPSWDAAIEEPLRMAAPRLIFYNTARDDGTVDDIDEGTWKYFPFNEQSLVALHRKLEEELAQGEDFVIFRRSAAVPRLFPVVLDLPPGNKDMEFVLVPESSM